MTTEKDRDDANEISGSYPDANLSEQELKQILSAHEKWLGSEDYTKWVQARDQDQDKGEYEKGRAKLVRANLNRAILIKVNLMGADLSEADLGGTYLRGANLRGADLNEANLSEADLEGADLSEADLGGADLSRANLSEAIVVGADLRGADLSRADLEGAHLIHAFLRKANLSGANLKSALLTRADLISATLRGAELDGANLDGADLNGADLSDAGLSAAGLIGADLTGVRLAGADLGRAKLLRADLTNASLVGAEVPMEELERKEQQVVGEPKQNGAVKKKDVPAEKAALPDATVAGTNFGMANLTGAKLPASLNEFRDSLKNVEETSKNARTIYFSMIALCAFVLLTVATTTDAQLILDNIRLKLPIIGAEVSVFLFYVSAPILGLLVFCYLHMYLAHLWELTAGLPAIFPDGLPLRRKLYPWMLNLVIEEWQRKGWAGWSLFKSVRAWSAIGLGWAMVPLTIGGVGYRLLVRHDWLFSYLFLVLLTGSVFLASALYQYARATVRNEDVGWRWLFPFLISIFVFSAGVYGTQQGLLGNLPFTTPRIVLRYEDLSGRLMSGLDLREASLSFAKLIKADLKGTNLDKADLRGADLSSADLDGASFREANLIRANLTQAELPRANLEGALLGRANLQEAFLFYANLQNANLGSANLQGAFLGRANLHGSDLGDSDLQGAILNGANLVGAEMNNANIQGADFRHSKFGGLQKTVGLTQSQIKTARNWQLAYYPDEFLKDLGLPKDFNQTLSGKLAELEKHMANRSKK